MLHFYLFLLFFCFCFFVRRNFLSIRHFQILQLLFYFDRTAEIYCKNGILQRKNKKIKCTYPRCRFLFFFFPDHTLRYVPRIFYTIFHYYHPSTSTVRNWLNTCDELMIKRRKRVRIYFFLRSPLYVCVRVCVTLRFFCLFVFFLRALTWCVCECFEFVGSGGINEREGNKNKTRGGWFILVTPTLTLSIHLFTTHISPSFSHTHIYHGNVSLSLSA